MTDPREIPVHDSHLTPDMRAQSIVEAAARLRDLSPDAYAALDSDTRYDLADVEAALWDVVRTLEARAPRRDA